MSLSCSFHDLPVLNCEIIRFRFVGVFFFFHSLTAFYSSLCCSPGDSFSKADSSGAQVESQDVKCDTGGKNEYVMYRNQQNCQGRAFVWDKKKK